MSFKIVFRPLLSYRKYCIHTDKMYAVTNVVELIKAVTATVCCTASIVTYSVLNNTRESRY